MINQIKAEPVAFGALIVVIISVVVALLKLDPAIIAGIDTIVTATTAFFVRGQVTPVASLPQAPAVVPLPVIPPGGSVL